MFALVLMAIVVSGVLSIVFVAPKISHKWDLLASKRWERKMLKGVAEIEAEEAKPTEAEIAEATLELEAEMEDWS
jgi:hypothetical protein